MRARWLLILVALLGLAAVSYWRSPYHQVRAIWSLVEIDAPADRVWQVLTDLNGYSSWNPLITAARGELKPGNTIAITLKLDNRTFSLHPRILAVQPGRRLAWLGHMLVPGIFDGEHVFELEQIDQSHTRVIQSERFHGVLVGFLWDRISPAISRGFRAMNHALKQRAEPSVATPQ